MRRVPRCANASSPAIGEAIGLATEEIAAACVLLRRLAVAARGHGRRPCLRAGGRHRCPAGPVAVRERAQRSGGEARAGRFALLAHVLVGVVAERSVRMHGGRHRDVIPFSGTDLEGGMYVAGPRNIHLQWPTAPEHGPGGGAGSAGKPALSDAALSPRGSGRRHLGNSS